MPKINTNLTINKLELSVHLGWTEQERQSKQVVWLDISIYFAKPPKACKTDELDDSICYQDLINHLRKEIGDRPFALLEHLTLTLHQLLKKQLPKNSKLRINTTKFPAILDLREGVSFCYEDN